VKRLILPALMLIVLLAAADPVPALEGNTKGDPANGPPSGPSPNRTATLSFELTVEGEPPEDTEFFGFIPAEGGISSPLTDPDSDALYTGSVDVATFPPGPAPPDTEPVSLPVQIVQRKAPGKPFSIIRDFGEVLIDKDKSFSGTISFPSGPGNREDTVTATFELTLEGTPPEDATFFGYLGYEPAPFQLTDPDGDGVYTGSTPPDLILAGDTQPALIVQGTGTRESQVVGTSPGEPISTIEDFGEVTFEEDTMLKASVSFGSSGSSGSGSYSGFFGNAAESVRGFLPSTGGSAALAVLGVGVILILSGLVVRRIFR
jgi:LPXTG-motif cell wall-anchored protein